MRADCSFYVFSSAVLVSDLQRNTSGHLQQVWQQRVEHFLSPVCSQHRRAWNGLVGRNDALCCACVHPGDEVFLAFGWEWIMPKAGDPSPLVTGLEGAPSIYSFIHLFTASLIPKSAAALLQTMGNDGAIPASTAMDWCDLAWENPHSLPPPPSPAIILALIINIYLILFLW